MSLPKRKNPRLKEYDYSTPGAYFVTICTHNKRHVFSNIVGAIHESPENILTKAGQIANDVIQSLPKRFGIELDKYVIMPNHIHLIISITDDMRAIRESPLRHQRSKIDKIIGYLKMNVSKQLHHLSPDTNIWQRSYHDHIIRNESDYNKIWEYIDTNVQKWEFDCFYE